MVKNKILPIVLILLLLLQSIAMAQYATLEQGATGDAVRKMQEALQSLGYQVTADGNFGRSTLRALLSFQKKQKLKADGKAGNTTLSKLYELANSKGNANNSSNNTENLNSVILPMESLRLGTQSQAVKEMQIALKKLGYMRGTPDGKFGAATEKALKAFQKKYKLSADGVAGDSTLRLLYGKAGIAVSGRVLSQEEIARQNANPAPTANPNAKNNASPNRISETVLPSESLRFGDSSTAVRDMQIALNMLGYNTKGTDGTFGEGTQAALKSFQKKYKLAQDGVAGRTTLRLLYRKAKVTMHEPLATAAPQVTAVPQITPVPTAKNNPRVLISNVVLPAVSLRKGDNNNDVRNMQLALTQIGYQTGGTDGKFGDMTESAVVQFQKDNRLSADGVAGQATLTRIYTKANVRIDGIANPTPTATPAPTQNIPDRLNSYNINETLAPGSSGSSVATMQIALKQLGYYKGSINSSFDKATKNAVIALQKAYNLSADGVAGAMTHRAIADLIAGKTPNEPKVTDLVPNPPSFQAPNVGSVQLLHWYNDVKGALRSGTLLKVYDPETGASYTLRVMSRGRHLDAEPLTAQDTTELFKAFGGRETWTPNNVYVQMPSGVWTLATTHNVAHSPQTIKDNNFNGHLCVHFLRDLDETQKIDPKYGMQNQVAIRHAWKKMTGQDIP